MERARHNTLLGDITHRRVLSIQPFARFVARNLLNYSQTVWRFSVSSVFAKTIVTRLFLDAVNYSVIVCFSTNLYYTCTRNLNFVSTLSDDKISYDFVLRICRATLQSQLRLKKMHGHTTQTPCMRVLCP